MGKIKSLFIKYKEIILYIIFGAITTLVNLAVYSVMVKVLKVDLSTVTDTGTGSVIKQMLSGKSGSNLTRLFISNLVAWVVGVAVAFFTNKRWVFESKIKSFSGVMKELGMFTGSRLVTGVMEWFLPSALVMLGINGTLFGVAGLPAKLIVSVAVVILNYVFSKILVFRKKKKKNIPENE